MTIITELIEGLRLGGYKVNTKWQEKFEGTELILKLEDYAVEIETPTSYINTIQFSINFITDDFAKIITEVPKLIVLVHSKLATHHHVQFVECNNAQEGNFSIVSLILEYKEVIDLG